MTRPVLRIVRPEDAPEESAARPTIDQLFQAHASYVAAIALRLLGRHDEIEDLVQDVFLDAQRARHKLTDPDKAKSWLAVVTVRKARRALRRRRLRHMLYLGQPADYHALASPSLSPEKAAMLAQIYRTLDELPASLRIAWSLRYLQGETLGRVAELCGCSLATAKRRIAAAHRAIDQGQSNG